MGAHSSGSIAPTLPAYFTAPGMGMDGDEHDSELDEGGALPRDETDSENGIRVPIGVPPSAMPMGDTATVGGEEGNETDEEMYAVNGNGKDDDDEDEMIDRMYTRGGSPVNVNGNANVQGYAQIQTPMSPDSVQSPGNAAQKQY